MFFSGQKFLTHKSCFEKPIIKTRVLYQGRPYPKRSLFQAALHIDVPGFISLGQFLAEQEQHPGNIDVNRTGIHAGSAQGFSLAEIGMTVDSF